MDAAKIISVDTMTGADQTGGDDPDSHSILCHRAGYMDSSGQWIEPALVMRNILVPGVKPNSLVCWWNIDVVEVEVYRMARYYQAVIAPEMNMDRGLVELLKPVLTPTSTFGGCSTSESRRRRTRSDG